MSAPRRISPAARARRALIVDLTAAAALATVVFQLAAGPGVIALFGIPVLLAGLVWIGVGRLFARFRLRRQRREGA